MTVYLILALIGAQIALIVAHRVGLLPRVSVVPRGKIGGSNGRNNAFSVRIADDLNKDDFAGVKAQEVWESGHKARLWNAVLVRVSKKHRRNMELQGHAEEIKAHPSDKQAEILTREALSLYRGYNGLFAHWKLADIEAELKARL